MRKTTRTLTKTVRVRVKTLRGTKRIPVKVKTRTTNFTI